jgi:hypothetical protein
MNEATKQITAQQAQGAGAPIHQDARPGSLPGPDKDAAGTGDIIVLAAFLGVFLLMCLMGILGFISKLWH